MTLAEEHTLLATGSEGQRPTVWVLLPAPYPRSSVQIVQVAFAVANKVVELASKENEVNVITL